MITSKRSLFLAVLVVLPVSCGGAAETTTPKTPEGQALELAVVHESCDVESSKAQKIDTNGDGKPDLVHVMSDGREVCRMIDFNFDGVPDTWIYFDEQGRIRRRESDFDRDGKLDEVAKYVNGEIVEKDRELTLDGKFDTWDFYVNGKLHHRLRDSNGDGKIDEWWTWPDPDKPECAVIAVDMNGDGKPDPGTEIDQCAPAIATQQASAAPAVAGDGGTGAAKPVTDDGLGAPAVPPKPAGGDAGVTEPAKAPAAGAGGAAKTSAPKGGAGKKGAK
jgi:hypothetical protein